MKASLDVLWLGLALGAVWCVVWPLAALAERALPPGADDDEEEP